MKVLQFLGLCGVLAACTVVDAQKNRPGYCNDEDDCTKKAPGYTCVSVQTTRDGVENVKQCLPNSNGQQVCTGILPGQCPSFSSSWGEEFRQISSVCAYILPEGKKIKCLKPGEAGKKGYVECLWVDDQEEGKQIGVIYGCVDFDGARLLFKKGEKSDKLASQFNYTEVINDKCVNPKNPKGASFVCSSRGTCSPTSAGQFDYACDCNVGYSGKYCEKIDDNKCYHDGVCGGGTCDLVKQVCTSCKPGTKGNKCAECDPTYEKPCSGRGECLPSDGKSTLGADGNSSSTSAASGKFQCKCNDGWTDTRCDVRAVGKQPVKASNTTAETPAPAAPSSAPSVVISLTVLAVSSIALLL